MDRAALLAKLREQAKLVEEERWNLEDTHWAADRALLEYIDDPEITEAYDSFDKWYS
ncbi:MAG: hypothetical protein FWC87_01125 [Acidimicrobiaceae bacterium]|nr:hypothetical protein [Acidimicrobiaceae bacterium]